MIEKLKEAYQHPIAQSAFDKYNTFKDTIANPFSERTGDFIANSDFIPDVIKEKYANIKDGAVMATAGLVGSAGLTAALRYQKPINKVIDKGVELGTKAVKSVNNTIDDFMYEEDVPSEDSELSY